MPFGRGWWVAERTGGGLTARCGRSRSPLFLTALRGAAVVRYSAPGIRPGGRPFFLLAKRKKAKKALQFKSMVLYTSAVTTAAIDSPARRAQTGGTRSTVAYPPAVMQRRLQVQSASHAASAQPPALWLAADSALPVQQPPLHHRRWVATAVAKCRLSEPAGREIGRAHV